MPTDDHPQGSQQPATREDATDGGGAPRLEDLLAGNLADEGEAPAWDDEALEDAPWAKSDADLEREALERELMAKSLSAPGAYRRGDKVTGTVVHIGGDDVFVDIGGKSEALLDAAEVRDENGELTVREGQALTLYVAHVDGADVRLSYRMALEARSREAVREAFAERTPIEGTIKSRNKGGFDVRFQSGQRAFLPLSQLELRRVEDDELDSYIGRRFEFLITKYESDGKNLVVSRAAVLREEQQAQREELQRTLAEGQIRTGIVNRIVDFGAFVDLGGLDGLVHISEIVWGHHEAPLSLLSPGQEVRVKVLRVDHGKGTVSLSMREAEGNPWDSVGTEFVEGGVYTGRVTRLEPFGAFVELAPGLEGLVHVSELAWERVRHPEAVVQIGEQVTVKLIRVEMDRRRLGLSIKALGGDPWTDVVPAWMRGQLLRGSVDRLAPFGVFVQLAPGVTGLIPLGDLGMDQSQAHLSFQPGKEITVELADVDLERRRIRLLPSDASAQGERDAVESYDRMRRESQQGLGTLGDLLGGLKLDD